MKKLVLLLVLAALALAGCESEEVTKFEASDVTDISGPTIGNGAATEVWAVTNAWADKDTPAARKAGVAWEENSGLTWEEKFSAWVESFEQLPREGWGGDTISIPTPWGDKVLPGPTLECAEVAYMLRATFASWYNLPFFVRGWDSTSKQTIFVGHFGFVNASGQNVGSFPLFKSRYKDYTSTWKVGDPWPSDSVLRSRRLASDDTVRFLTGPNGEEYGAGAYFDELFLNKRTGHFMRLLLLYFGSVNLADGSNMFHIQPEAMRGGDVLIERWQKKGIGHVIPVLRVTSPIEGKLAAEVASGSMPRRQPVYEDALRSRRYFTLDYTGGVGEASDGTPYAKLGGGIRRWRTAVLKGGRWINEVLPGDKPIAIADSDLEAISARPARFEEILISGSVSEQKTALISVIQSARTHLSKYPASCSARDNREKAFEQLYKLAGALGTTREALDDELRTLDDYVFAPLVYEQSKTCCWNSTDAAMAEIVLDYARVEREEAEANQTCVEPTVFRSRTDGYDTWRKHAESLGRSAEWKAWSEDEPCAQRAVAQDTEKEFGAAPYCSN